MHYGMVIDVRACIGCNCCAIICKSNNNVPEGIWWNRIMTEGGDLPDTPAGEWPKVTMSYLPMSCQHCENPACVKVCPVAVVE